MSRYKGWILAVAIVSCGTVTAPIDTTDTVALYYVESQRVEPWGQNSAVDSAQTGRTRHAKI
jgi:hypothetical protein